MADLYCDYIHNTAQSLPITKHLQHNKNIKDTIFIKKKNYFIHCYYYTRNSPGYDSTLLGNIK